MPDLIWNKTQWNKAYNWDEEGEEWSSAWGSSYAQWITMLFPRISKFVPAGNILEIAPGYGRWTRLLLQLCNNLWGVDIAEKCIQNCKKRFKEYNNAHFIKNDGTSLSMIDDRTIDFCFSFDSLVHVELDILENYLKQILMKLNQDGVAFIHHSNFEEYAQKGVQNNHHRGRSVSLDKVRNIIEENGGKVLVQEKYNWGEVPQNLIDGFTLFCRNDCAKYPIQTTIISNSYFAQEASYAKDIINNYVFK